MGPGAVEEHRHAHLRGGPGKDFGAVAQVIGLGFPAQIGVVDKCGDTKTRFPLNAPGGIDDSRGVGGKRGAYS